MRVIFLKPFFLHTCIFISYGYSTFDKEAWCDKRSVFEWSLTDLNLEFAFSLAGCHTKIKEFRLPYYLPIVGGRIVGCIPFSMLLALCKMQTTSSRTWTRIAVSISYDISPRMPSLKCTSHSVSDDKVVKMTTILFEISTFAVFFVNPRQKPMSIFVLCGSLKN